jgi:large subunit ribosomal protein L19
MAETETTVQSPVKVIDRKNLDIRSGDTVRVWQKIVEKGKTRLQAFEGLVIAVKHGKEAGATFTVRRVASGVGVEKIFPLYSPMIDSLETLKRSKVRRAKLYHIRNKAAKEIRRQMRNIRALPDNTPSSDEPEAVEEVEATETKSE